MVHWSAFKRLHCTIVQLFLEYDMEANSPTMRAEQIAGTSSHVNFGIAIF